ncbi:DMT family transporter [Streptomyces alkaliphilus]|uniref:DMT family transporter n=1 Tax=Streptomyces alkaliphilus TaxID=1472722 RepID=UPI00117BE71A|nr:DMT family transporter [Streptomyces alkaliphilus]MQS06939.1 EamA family transporter [Streptomyces alkaliphilus]
MRAQDSATRLRAITVPTSAPGGTLPAALAVVAFSLSFPATAMALEGFGPWTVTGVRGLVAGLLAAACLAAARVPRPERRHLPDLLTVAGGCGIAFPLFTALALRTSDTGHSAVVIGILPLATAVISSLLTGGRPSRTFWTAAGIGAVAVIAFTLGRAGGPPTPGDGYLFAAVLAAAAGYARGGRLASHLPGWQVIGWAVVAALPVSAAVTVGGLTVEPVDPGPGALAGLLYLAAVSQFGGFVLWYRGMALIGVPRASQLQLAQPLLTLVWAVLLMGERLPASAPLTAVVVLACVVVTQRSRA